jgi:RND family efflux transporter MFP subunit
MDRDFTADDMKRMSGGWTPVWMVLALTGLLAACGDAEAGGASGQAVGEEPFVRVINVQVDPVLPELFIERVMLSATVAANRDVTVSAEESGTVTAVLVEKGARVRAGQAVLRIDDRVLRSQVDQARAAAELARETWERRKRLWEEDQVGSELAYLEARFAAEQSAANLRTLEERLARTVIRAPVEGLLEDRLVELGALVAPGTPVIRIVDADPVKILAGVPERYAPDVSVGAPATVTFDVLPDAGGTGTVHFVGAAVDPRSRTFPVEVEMPNPGGVIKPEMVANVSLERRTLEEAVVVPQDALVRREDGYVVFVVEGYGDDARAAERRVTLGPSQANRVVVAQGLTAGERLVVVGQKSVAAGDRVRIVEER